MFRRSLAPLLFWFLPLAIGCTSVTSSEDDSSRPSYTAATDAGRTRIVSGTAGADVQEGAAPPAMNPLCGGGEECNPDDFAACSSLDSSPNLGAGGSASGGGVAGATGLGGAGGAAPSEPAGGAGGSDLQLPEYDGGIEDEQGGAKTFACRVSDRDGEPVARCGLAGAGEEDAPCIASSDCAPGFACVGEPMLARCRPFCCAGNSMCGEGTYCAERPLHDAASGSKEAQLVPVCVTGQDCSLSDPYPCPEGTDCSCESGKACMVVRASGLTACLEPGEGQHGNACPCAAGYVCSQATDKCMQLCRTNAANNDCGSGHCQVATHLPDGWGLCIGMTQPDAG